MNDIATDQVDPELVAQLRADFEPAQAIAKERVSQRLAASIGALALNAQAPAPSTLPARTVATGLGALRAHPLVFLLGFAFGSAAGAGLVASLRPQPKAEVRSARPASQSSEVAPTSLAPHIAASAPLLPAVIRPAVSVSTSPVASTEHGAAAHLAEQQALLDVARKALSAGDYADALQTLAAHFRRYPKSILTEEREALQIKALVASGQLTTAQARAAQFKARFPQSLLLPALTDSVGAIP
jgi:hypothetical protein